MSGKIKEGLNVFPVLLRCSVIVSRRFQLSVKQKQNQTNYVPVRLLIQS